MFYCNALNKIHKFLNDNKIQFMLVKGFFNQKRYNKFYREFSDVDILIDPKDYSIVKKEMTNLGYVQKNYHASSGKFFEYYRKEIYTSKLTTHEFLLFIKEVRENFSIFIDFQHKIIGQKKSILKK